MPAIVEVVVANGLPGFVIVGFAGCA